LFSGVDLSGFGTAVGTLGAGILVIVLALKAISVVKAAIGKL
jgi:tetrahydromethanopterin S-methyltransferase subunit F